MSWELFGARRDFWGEPHGASRGFAGALGPDASALRLTLCNADCRKSEQRLRAFFLATCF